MAMNDVVIRLDDVTVVRGGCTILQDCDLRLHPGQRLGLSGSIGSGKTTILHLIVGLLRPTHGTVTVFGKPRCTEKAFSAIRGRVGLLFQDSDDQLFCATVADDIAFGPLNLGYSPSQARKTVAEVLSLLGLPGYEDRITTTLSGGEKRLVALATVLAMSPEVLLLDEPTTGLDDEAAERVTSVIENLPQAMLITSHDSAFLARVAHQTLVLHAHRLRESANMHVKHVTKTDQRQM